MRKRILSLILIGCLLITALCGCYAPRTEIWEWEDSSLTMEIPVYWVEPINDEEVEEDELYLENALHDAVMISYVYDLDAMDVTYTAEELFNEQTDSSLDGENVTQKGECNKRELSGGRTLYEEIYTGDGIDYYCAMVDSGENEAVWMMFVMEEGNDFVMNEAVKIAENAKWNANDADEGNML